MAAQRKVGHPRRGEVYLVNFEPTLGSEIKKTRPALILQNDIANRFSPLTIVAAISSKFEERLYPTEILVEPPEGGLTKPAVVLLNQIRSIDKQRLLRRIGRLKPETMQRVDQALQVSLGMIKV